MTQPTVSIIIPCYRQAHFLSGAIDSALGQTYPAVEVIVVNDGSDDNTDDVAVRYGRRITYIKQQNQGLASARNAGIARAAGKYLLVLDSDDEIHVDAIGWLVDAAANRDALCVMGFREFGDSRVYPDRFPTEQGDPRLALLHTNLGPPHCYLSTREMVIRSGGFRNDKRFYGCEDWDMWIRLAFAGAEISTVQRIGAYYRQHSNSMSRNLSRMAEARVQVMWATIRETLSNPRMIQKIGANPGRLRRVLKDQIAQEYLDAAYHNREERMYSTALRQYLQSTSWGTPKIKALVGICKLIPHRLLRSM